MRIFALLTVTAAVVFGAGCNKTVYRAYESHYCSSTEDDDPYHECARSSDLVCINTYQQAYPQPDGRPPVVRDMWLCRIGCDPAKASATCMADEVCCPGAIYGRSYGFMHGCVPPTLCMAIEGMTPVRDGGNRDTRDGGDASSDAGADLVSDAVMTPIDAADVSSGETSDAVDAVD